MSIKLNENDMTYVAQIYDALTKAMSGMPHELMKSGRFGAWAVTATANMLCKLVKLMNLDKAKLHYLIDDIWNDQENRYKVLN